MGLDLNELGVPSVDQATCSGCGRCVEVCSSRSLTLEAGRPTVVRRMFMGCIGCGQCVTVCPNGSITVQGRRFELGRVVDLPPQESRATPEQLDALLLSRAASATSRIGRWTARSSIACWP